METMFIQVFSDMDFLGWYSTGDSPGVQEITVHQQISDINESPLFLQVNLSFILKLVFTLFIQMAPGAASTDLPVSLYESVIDMVNLQVNESLVDLYSWSKQPTWIELSRRECCLSSFLTHWLQKKLRELDWTMLLGLFLILSKCNEVLLRMLTCPWILTCNQKSWPGCYFGRFFSFGSSELLVIQSIYFQILIIDESKPILIM